MIKHIIFSIVALYSTCGALYAQKEVSLKECLELGLKQNYDIQIVRGEEKISDNNATLAAAGLLPTLDLSAGYNGSLTTTHSTATDDVKTSTYDVFDQSASAGVNLNWTIFEGMKLRTSYKKLQELQNIGHINSRITIEDFVASIVAEYYNLVQQTLRLENYRYAVELSRERLRITEERFKIGSFSRLDLLQTRVDFNADSSRYMSQQEAVMASRIRINELIALQDINQRITARDTSIVVNKDLIWETLHENTLKANSQLLMAENQTRVSELDLRSVRSRNYPYLKLTAGYGYNYNRYGNSSTHHRSSLGPDLGLKLGFSIFDGNRRREQTNARIELDNARLTVEKTRQSLIADLANFYQAYRNNIEVIALEEQNLIAARENYEIAKERYLLGDLPGIEMREAQLSLLDAEERLLSAKYNTKLCEISLRQISGDVQVYLE